MSQPQVLAAKDPRFAAVHAYLERYTASQGLNARYRVDGDELHLEAAHE
jgi:hypothetical protein